MADEIEKNKKESWLRQKVKNISSYWGNWQQPVAVIGIITLLFGWVQNCNSNKIAKDQQKLFALQIINNRLTGNRIDRELTLNLTEAFLDDADLTDSLRKISYKATLEIASEGIWSKTEKERVDAIKDLSILYYKGYASAVISILRKRVPPERYIDRWEPVISISNFFKHLERSDPAERGIWYGTKKDSLAFAYLKNSKYYKDDKYQEYQDSSMVPEFLDSALAHFREIKE